MAYVNSDRVSGFNPLAWFENALATASKNREKRAVYLKTLNELSQMSDRELADINVSRLQLREIAMQAAYGK